MKYFLSITGILTVLLFVSTSYKTATPPDIDSFSKKFIEVINKRDKQQYIDALSLAPVDLQWMLKVVNDDTYLDDERKTMWLEVLNDTVLISNVHNETGLSYDQIDEWMQKEGIESNEIEFIRLDYEIKYEHRIPFCVMDGFVYVKHKDRYYCIVIDDLAYINNKWVGGDVQKIFATTAHLEFDYYQGMEADSTVKYVDTTATAPEYYEEAMVDTTAMVPSSKKQRKIQTKIGKHYQKIYKLEDELYIEGLN